MTRVRPPNTSDQQSAGTAQAEGEQGYSGAEELWDIEAQLLNYNRAIVDRFERQLAGRRKLLDFGAGIGSLAKIWREVYGIDPECLEIDTAFRATLEERGFVVFGELSSVPAGYEGIYTSNVLEHIDDDQAALRALHRLLQDDAKLVIFVPAFMCLYSAMDTAVGHYRRYGRRELRDKLRGAGFEVMELHYVDSIGFFASLAIRLLGHRSGANLGGRASMGFYDRYIYPISDWLDRLGAKHLLGKNIFAVARKRPSED